MSHDPQKTVFISYRRSTSKYLARLIFKTLHDAGYDVFLDVNTIDSGAFDEIILRQIAARAHFVILLSPGALERCTNEGDWLRREIEEAMRLQRNIIPIIEENFNFQLETDHLPQYLRADFRRYNSIGLYHEYFDAAIDKLISRFLKDPVVQVHLMPVAPAEQVEIRQRVTDAIHADMPTEQQLNAEEYYNRGLKKQHTDKDLNGAVQDYTEAIRLYPSYAQAYMLRGTTFDSMDNHNQAIADYTEAIRLNPGYAEAYANRGMTRHKMGDFQGAIRDFNGAINLGTLQGSELSSAYLQRGLGCKETGDTRGALADYNAAIRIAPQDAHPYAIRANLFLEVGDLDNTIADYTQAIHLDHPMKALIYSLRAHQFAMRNEYDKAIADYAEAIKLNPSQPTVKTSLFFGRGNALLNIHQVDSAIADFSEILRFDPMYKPAYLSRASAYEAKGNLEAARTDYQHYLNLGYTEQGVRQHVEGRIAAIQQKLASRRGS